MLGGTDYDGGSRSMFHTIAHTLFQLRGQTWAGFRPLLVNKWR
jgi:hypothetical protein